MLAFAGFDSDLESEDEAESAAFSWSALWQCCVYCLVGLWVDAAVQVLESWGIGCCLRPHCFEEWLDDGQPVQVKVSRTRPERPEPFDGFGVVVLS